MPRTTYGRLVVLALAIILLLVPITAYGEDGAIPQWSIGTWIAFGGAAFGVVSTFTAAVVQGDRVLRKLTTVDERVLAVDTKVDKLVGVDARVMRLEERIDHQDSEIDVIQQDVAHVKGHLGLIRRSESVAG
jgi:uncharacterized membrane protein YjfL (UPF0719 family)